MGDRDQHRRAAVRVPIENAAEVGRCLTHAATRRGWFFRKPLEGRLGRFAGLRLIAGRAPDRAGA